MKNKSLSVIIPCFNEEGNIRNTVEDLRLALRDVVDDYEFLIFDDQSTDGTRKVIEELAKSDKKIRPIYNATNMGLGYSYRKGVELASKEYVILVPGDNEIRATSIREICLYMGQADIVIPYIANYYVRPLHRQALSKLFTLTVNTLTGYKVKYYNGAVLHKKELLKKIELKTDGFAYQAEIVTQLLRLGHTYIEVPMVLSPRQYGASRALSKKNIKSVLKTLRSLLK